MNHPKIVIKPPSANISNDASQLAVVARFNAVRSGVSTEAEITADLKKSGLLNKDRESLKNGLRSNYLLTEHKLRSAKSRSQRKRLKTRIRWNKRKQEMLSGVAEAKYGLIRAERL
jgi:hypothetical protein